MGLSSRPAAASRSASKASLDQPTDSCPASIAGAMSTGPVPCGAACAARRDASAVIARHGPGWLAETSARTRLMMNSMRLSLRGGNPAEWLALRLGLVPSPAAESWGGMALAGVLVAAVRTGLTERLARGQATPPQIAADLGLDPVPVRLLLECLRSAGHVTARSGQYGLSRSGRRWL